jgi:hypothetical protein
LGTHSVGPCDGTARSRSSLPGQIIHADKYGFLAIPREDEARLLDAGRFTDSNRCQTVTPAARGSAGKSEEQILADIRAAGSAFNAAVRQKFGKRGKW